MQYDILLHGFSRPLKNGQINPKNYPYWEEVIKPLSYLKWVQVGISGDTQLVSNFKKDCSWNEIVNCLQNSKIFISIDSFIPHLANLIGKRGVVIWGPSDPHIFGYSHNINLLKSRDRLRKNQFQLWEQCEYDSDRFIDPSVVIDAVEQLLIQVR